MKLVIISGPHAVGKMTVGQELSKLTGLKLFHNHMTIEPVCDIFENLPSERARLTALFRDEVFMAFAKSGEYGMIFTYMWAYDIKEDWDYIEHVTGIFKQYDAQIYFVELCADKDERLRRNATPNRLINKPSKRNLELSLKRFETLENKYRLNSIPGEIKLENYFKLNNTSLSPEEAAALIREHFNL